MFGKKNTTSTDIQHVVLTGVKTIPTEFYAEANPVISFHNVPKEVNLGKEPQITRSEKEALQKATTVGSGQPMHLANLLTSTKFLLITGGTLFILSLLGAGVYYWYTLRNQREIQNPLPPVNSTQTADNPVNNITDSNLVEVATTTESVSTTTQIKTPGLEPLELPAVGLVDSGDADHDLLTDKAETVFATNPALPDSDSDGYGDEHEIYYLYNPAGKEPMKLIDAGTVKEYANPARSYSIYYPANWAVGDAKGDYTDILFSTLDGDNIEVMVLPKNEQEDFVTWLAGNFPNEPINDYRPFESRFGASGYERSDKMVYFMVGPTQVVALVYHVGNEGVVNYRVVLNMMARSLNLVVGQTNMLPAQTTSLELPLTATTSSATSMVSSTIPDLQTASTTSGRK